VVSVMSGVVRVMSGVVGVMSGVVGVMSGVVSVMSCDERCGGCDEWRSAVADVAVMDVAVMGGAMVYIPPPRQRRSMLKEKHKRGQNKHNTFDIYHGY
jgi:hypothetical protein